VEHKEEMKADEVSREIPAVASLSDAACGQAWGVRSSGRRPRGEKESPGAREPNLSRPWARRDKLLKPPT
jgi:hypothetical protein